MAHLIFGGWFRTCWIAVFENGPLYGVLPEIILQQFIASAICNFLSSFWICLMFISIDVAHNHVHCFKNIWKCLDCLVLGMSTAISSLWPSGGLRTPILICHQVHLITFLFALVLVPFVTIMCNCEVNFLQDFSLPGVVDKRIE